jgi:hypothetical protein
VLCSTPDNHASQRVAERCGFTREEVRVRSEASEPEVSGKRGDERVLSRAVRVLQVGLAPRAQQDDVVHERRIGEAQNNNEALQELMDEQERDRGLS